MRASSTSISQIANNAQLTNPNGQSISNTNLPSQVKINLQNGVNYLNITGTDLNNVSNFTYNNGPNASRILVINVDASGTFDWNVWNQAGVGNQHAPYILYNFYNTTQLNIEGNSTIEGTVFAPFADIEKSVNQSNIEGQVIGKSLYHAGGEMHCAAFTSNVSAPVACTTADNTTTTASITEGETKTLSGAPAGGTWSIVSGGGTINGTTYTPDDINVNTDVTIRYTIAADGSCAATSEDVTFTVTPVCDVVADNTTTTASITENQTKTLSGAPAGGTWSIVSGGGTINGTTYTPDDINVNTDVTIRYTIAADGSCAATTEDVTFTVTPVCDVVADNTTTTASITENQTKTLSGAPAGGTWSIVSGGGTINGTTYTPDDINVNTDVTIRYTIAADGSCAATSEDVTFTVTPVCDVVADNTTTTASITEDQTKTLSGAPAGGTWSIVSGGGTINGTTYTPDDINVNTDVTIRYTIAADGSCAATTEDVTFTVTPIILVPVLPTNISCNNNATLNVDADDFISFTLNPTPPTALFVSPYTYDISATQGGVPVTIELVDVNSGSRFGYDTDYNVTGARSGGGDVTVTVTPNYGTYSSVDYVVTDPGSCSSSLSCATETGNTVTYSVKTELINNNQTISLPKFDPNPQYVLKSVDISYETTYLRFSMVESGSNSATYSITGDFSQELEYTGGSDIDNFYTIPTQSGTSGAAVAVPAQGTWAGDNNGFTLNTLFQDGWLKYNILTGKDFTLDPRWVTNATGDLTTDDDISYGRFEDTYPNSVSYTGASDLANFIGTGNVPLTFSGEASFGSRFNTGNVRSKITSRTTMSFQITYTYDCVSFGSIGDTVWYDTDGDGIKDVGENELEGATVTLDPGTPGNPNDDIVSTTDANGNYLFSNLLAGNYTVSVDISTVTGGLPSGIALADLVQTFDADGVGTSNTSSLTLASGENNLEQDFAFIAPSGGTSGGNSGGVESESLGDAISKIYVGRKKNSAPTEFVKSSANLYNKKKMKSAQPYQGKGQTLLDMFPTELVSGNVANVTSPTDILDYTIADEVLSVDFSIDGKTKGVVLGIKTSDKIYNHTKASCDRLRGAEILNIQKVHLKGFNFLMQGIKQRNGVVEYAISFATAKNNNDSNYTIQTNWYVNNYTKFNDVYNFQVWSTKPADTQKMVADILDNLQTFIPVNQTEVQKFPETYASKIYRDKGELVVNLRSTEVGNTAEVSMTELYSETANNIKHRYNSLNTEIQQALRLDIADGYEYDGLVKVDNEVKDAFYHADGNWGLDYDKNYTEVLNYFVWNDFDRTYQDDEYTINRNVEIKATSEYDYLTVYKSLLPGTLSADYSEYKYLSFTAKGSGLMELGLIKSSVENWKEQYRVMVDLSEEEQTYYVPFDIFTSTGTTDLLTADDLTTIAFTFLPVEANTKELDLFISNVKFTKTAIEDQTIAKIETFENNFMAYPNPSKGNVNVLLFSEIDANATVSLYDVTGKEIYSAPTTLTAGKNEIDFNVKVKPGIMFLKVTSKKVNYGTSKIMFN